MSAAALAAFRDGAARHDAAKSRCARRLQGPIQNGRWPIRLSADGHGSFQPSADDVYGPGRDDRRPRDEKLARHDPPVRHRTGVLRPTSGRRDRRQSATAPQGARIARAAVRVCGPARRHLSQSERMEARFRRRRSFGGPPQPWRRRCERRARGGEERQSDGAPAQGAGLKAHAGTEQNAILESIFHFAERAVLVARRARPYHPLISIGAGTAGCCSRAGTTRKRWNGRWQSCLRRRLRNRL